MTTIEQFLLEDPYLSLEYIQREAVKTILVLGSNDGPSWGIVGYYGDKYLAYSPNDDLRIRRFLMVKMSEEQAEELIQTKGKKNFVEVRDKIVFDLSNKGEVIGYFEDWFDEKDPVGLYIKSEK